MFCSTQEMTRKQKQLLASCLNKWDFIRMILVPWLLAVELCNLADHFPQHILFIGMKNRIFKVYVKTTNRISKSCGIKYNKIVEM